VTESCPHKIFEIVKSFNKSFPYESLTYDISNQQLVFTRHCGLGSNILVLIRDLFNLKTRNVVPDKIKTSLTQYHNYDIYDNLLYINKEKLPIWNEMNPGEVITKFNKTNFGNLSRWGFGNSSKDVNFSIYTPLLDVYVNLTDNVIQRSKELEEKFNINVQEDVFVWWRKTDKNREVLDYPTINDLIKYLPNNKKIIFQTDDKAVGEELKNLNLNIQLLDCIPFAKSHRGAHHEISNKNEAYEHMRDILALSFTASKCSLFVGYPGSISQLVCILKRGFKNSIVFKSWPKKDTLFTVA